VKLYLDFNSTHPPDVIALEKSRAFYINHYANTSGLSAASQLTHRAVENAREKLAALLSIKPQQVIFTSCATESNNLLIQYFYNEFQKRAEFQKNKHPSIEAIFHVISSSLEHPSISETLKALPATDIEFIRFSKALKLRPMVLNRNEQYDVLCTVAVHSESGLRLPLEELFSLYRTKARYILCDYTQALGRLTNETTHEVSWLTRQDAFLTASGHKIGGGFGCGLIILPDSMSQSTHPMHLTRGGNQEFQIRAGSHNIEAIIAFAEALEHRIQENNEAQWKLIQNKFESMLRSKLAFLHGFEIIGSQADRAPGTSLLYLPNIPIDFLIMALDTAGITASTGTSCKSRARAPSQSLMHCGYTEAETLSVLRLSYDQTLTEAQIEYASGKIAEICRAL